MRNLLKLRDSKVIICGCGALGSRLALDLARLGVYLELVDFDNVEEHNSLNQVYSLRDVGLKKVNALANIISLSTQQSPTRTILHISEANVKKLREGLIVDCFDNLPSRIVLREHGLARHMEVLHVGVSEDTGEIVWNSPQYLQGAYGRDVCAEPLSLPLIAVTAGLALESIIQFSLGRKRDVRFYLPLLEVR